MRVHYFIQSKFLVGVNCNLKKVSKTMGSNSEVTPARQIITSTLSQLAKI